MLSAAAVVVCALDLLGRSPSSTAPIKFLNSPPPGVSRNAEAFVVMSEPTIYLITSSEAFSIAMRSQNAYNNRDVFQKLASIIVHEEWHLRNGADERGAYQAQLTTLEALGAPSPLVGAVRKAMFVAVDAQKRSKPELLVARGK